MMVAQPSAIRVASFSVVAVAASVAVPVLVHLVPSASALGSALLPIFWAPLLAVFLFGPVPGLAAGVLAPVVNHWLTGHPPQFMLSLITLELAIFTGLLALASRDKRLRMLPVLAPVAYVIARLSAAMVMGQGVGLSGSVAASWAGLGSSVPGLFGLFVINLGIVLAAAKRTPRA